MQEKERERESVCVCVCVCVLTHCLYSDWTIISGNSMGSVEFWDGQVGVRFHQMNYHTTSILAMTHTPVCNSNRVESSRVDIVLVSDRRAVLLNESERTSSGDGRSRCQDFSASQTFLLRRQYNRM
jgi:WD40 repeat protein